MSTDRIGIFIATMTGLAEICAEEIAHALSEAGFDTESLLMDGLGAEAVADFKTVVIVSSTYGHGDIPDNGQAFHDALQAGGELTEKSYAVFGLGDRTYMDTFCHAAERWDALFTAKGATSVAPLERFDASSGMLAEDEAGAWAARWAPRLKMAA